MDSNTIEFYNEHADEFLQRTEKADMYELQNKFLVRLKKGCSILDLGCGSGSDSLYFSQHGYKAVMVDASDAMCTAAEKLTGLKAIKGDFLTFKTDEKFDAVWACASLLHLHKADISKALIHLAPMLNDSACIYMSFKYGDFEGEIKGRYFAYLDEAELKNIIDQANVEMSKCNSGRFIIEKLFTSNDVRPGNDTKWLNAFVNFNYGQLYSFSLD